MSSTDRDTATSAVNAAPSVDLMVAERSERMIASAEMAKAIFEAMELENASLKRQLEAKTEEVDLVRHMVREYVDTKKKYKELQKKHDEEHFKVESLKSTIGELKESVGIFKHRSIRWEKSFGVEKKAKEIWKKRVQQKEEEIARAKKITRTRRAMENHNAEGGYWM